MMAVRLWKTAIKPATVRISRSKGLPRSPADRRNQVAKVDCRYQAISQVCAFHSLFCGVMSAMGIFQQLTGALSCRATVKARR